MLKSKCSKGDGAMNSKLDIRPSPIAGQWYPGNPQQLADSVDGYLDGAHLQPITGKIVGVVVPHAGHRYSGPVAGYAFALLREMQPDLVAIISPMHYNYPQPLLTSAHDAYLTPLGEVQIDREAVNQVDAALRASLGSGLYPVRNDPEHSLEIELPFLQRALSTSFNLLPVMVRDVRSIVARRLGEALALTLRGRNSLLVASTDLSHFYPQETADKFDLEMLRRIEAFDPQGILDAEDEGKGYACGRGALAAVLWAARELGADQVKVLRHATSGDVTGDFSQVVGYGAAVITQSGG
jgi:AmmeMemoRadiSam system protein B